MTKPRTSIEKLETRNEKVKDLKSALDASRWKWKEISEQTYRFWNLIDHKCGFCLLASLKRKTDEPKCDFCPKEVKVECDRIQLKSPEIVEELDKLILSTRAFLRELKY